MSDIIGAGIAALDKLVSVAQETRRREREKPFCSWSAAGFERFREWDAAVCRACDEAGILQPNVKVPDQYTQLLGFVRLPFLKGRIPRPPVAWYEAMQTLRVRLQGAAERAEPGDAGTSNGQPERTPKRKPATVEQRMLTVVERNLEAQFWSAKQFADNLGCSKTAVAETKLWKSLQSLRARAKKERMDRNRQRER
jgi:hypothetical protein